MLEVASFYELDNTFVSTYEFRSQNLDEAFVETMSEQNTHDLGALVAYYLLEEQYGMEWTMQEWQAVEIWSITLAACEAIWNDIEYFPVPESTTNGSATVSYIDTWGESRTYGGERLHEGTDIIAAIDTPGLYPVVSVTDGVVTNMGWLEQGGYRIGITSESGGYFYYAHLDSYSAIVEGDTVEAGQLLGYMGDSGYGEEGTTGMFPVHLHLGIYIDIEGEETSVNPYWILKILELHKLKSSF